MTIKLAYTITEAAEASGLGEFQIKQAIRAGTLRTKVSEGSTEKKVGKRVILRSALESYLEGLADG